MSPPAARREGTDMKPNVDVTWRGIAVGYGLVLVVFAVMWAIGYPILAATLLALIGGIYAVNRAGARIVRRRSSRGRGRRFSLRDRIP